MLITGRAYGRRATLEVTGTTLHWRAQRGQLQRTAENIATTTHDVRDATWLQGRWSWGGLSIMALAVVWMITESLAFGLGVFAIGAAWLAYRLVRPRMFLALDLGTRWLVLRVDKASATNARTLAERIQQQLLSGEVAAAPSALP